MIHPSTRKEYKCGASNDRICICQALTPKQGLGKGHTHMGKGAARKVTSQFKFGKLTNQNNLIQVWRRV
jgi:hypothetical protein